MIRAAIFRLDKRATLYFFIGYTIVLPLFFYAFILPRYLEDAGRNKSVEIASLPRLAVATYVNLDSNDFRNDSYIHNSIVLLKQLKRFHQDPRVDYLFLYSNKGPLSSKPAQLPHRLGQILKDMGVIPVPLSEDEGTPLWWFFKMEVQGNDGYKRCIGKIHLWNLEDQYDKILYVDADIIITSDIVKPLFSLSQGYDLSAVMDGYIGQDYQKFNAKVPYGAQNYFNSGLMVLRPSKKVYENMNRFFGDGSFQMDSLKEWDHHYTDQDFLNFYFGCGWNRLPAKYNLQRLVVVKDEIIDSTIVFHDKIWKSFPQARLPKKVALSYVQDLKIIENQLKY